MLFLSQVPFLSQVGNPASARGLELDREMRYCQCKMTTTPLHQSTIRPPLVFSAENVAFFLDRLDSALRG